MNSSHPPKLNGNLTKAKTTPGHLLLITEQGKAADYKSFSSAAGLAPGGAEVHRCFVVGFRPQSRLMYPLLPFVFNVLGGMVHLWDLQLATGGLRALEAQPAVATPAPVVVGKGGRDALVRDGHMHGPPLHGVDVLHAQLHVFFFFNS